jgi:hypothetical protein
MNCCRKSASSSPNCWRRSSAPALPGTGAIAAPTAPRTFTYGQRFQYNWCGKLLDLTRLRPGENGTPPIFMSPKPEGIQ